MGFAGIYRVAWKAGERIPPGKTVVLQQGQNP